MSEDQFEIDLAGGGGSSRPGELVVRSSVEPGLKYGQYRRFLRTDFFYSCGYCAVSEYEAGGVRFTIDHYEPVSARPELEDTYDNLIYCCDECNIRKGDLTPPPEARAKGFRFFRPDQDVRSDHMELSGQRLSHITHVGQFSIDALDLNRLSLRRIRDIRRRLYDCDQHVADGLRALQSLRIDQIPPQIRARAVRAIEVLSSMASETSESVDEFLKQAARSPMLDEDPEAEQRRLEAASRLKEPQGLYPGKWRGRKPRQKKPEVAT